MTNTRRALSMKMRVAGADWRTRVGLRIMNSAAKQQHHQLVLSNSLVVADEASGAAGPAAARDTEAKAASR
jgi:hypothetical protein